MRPLGPGARLAPGYEVLAHLHRSNVLDVYDAWSEERQCRCVVKVLRPDRRDDRGARRRLLAEGRLLQRLSHPNIVRGYETLRGPRPAVVMETLTGETLAHLAQRRRLTTRELAFLGIQLGSALAYLHRAGVVHLDLKPSNVVAENGRAKLLDMSIARRPGRMRPGRGTWCYMAPEQARGGEVGPAADVWGLGAVLWEAATGEALFGDDGDEDHPQLVRRAPALSSRRRLPAALAATVDRCLEPESARRPSLEEIARELRGLAGARG